MNKQYCSALAQRFGSKFKEQVSSHGTRPELSQTRLSE
uniref:Uncharacterized protein n=1 Tax=Anguilla anguilla TaxID=7936 RepID=A0A0E9QXG5_ANGAN